MKYFLISSMWMLLLTGCATMQNVNPSVLDHPQKKPCCACGHRQHFTQPTKSRFCKTHRLSRENELAQKHAFHTHTKNRKSTNVIKDGFIAFSYQPAEQPIIHTAPFQITVIRLEPGEKFTNISSGDPSRWSYAVAVSGKEESAQQNILVKPSLPDISTNLVITTDKRLYNVRLVASQTDAPTRSVDFWYPEEALKKDDRKNMSDVLEEPLDNVCFKNTILHHPQNKQSYYRITTAGLFSRPPAWQPVRVFDEDEKTYIQFPDNIAEQDLPVLFAVNQGQKECVNYRFQSPYFIVDKRLSEGDISQWCWCITTSGDANAFFAG